MTAHERGSHGGHTARRIVVFLAVVVAALLLGGLGSGPGEGPATDPGQGRATDPVQGPTTEEDPLPVGRGR